MKQLIWAVWVLLLLYPFSIYAQLEYEIGGYTTYMFSGADSGSSNTWDHLLQARLNSTWYFSDAITGVFETRFRAYQGDSISGTYFKNQVTGAYSDPTLDTTLWDTADSFGYAQIDRLYLDYYGDPLQVTVGRQRIAWGTALVWNVIDLFNSGSLLDLSYEEGAGADSLRVQYYTGPVSKIEMAGLLNDAAKQTLAGKWQVNVGAYDLSLVLAQKDNRSLIGGAWAGSIGDAGFRGEIALMDAPNKGTVSSNTVNSLLGESLYASDDSVMAMSLSADYTFENTFYIHSELLYNSNGKSDNAGAFTYQSQDAGMLSPAKLSFFQEFSYNLTPLWRSGVFAFINPDDTSWVLVPSITWSARDNLDMVFTGYLADGSATSEWGSVNNTLIWQVKYAF